MKKENNTAAQTAKEKKARLQDHLSAIVQSSEDAIISKSMDGSIIYWNDGAERIFGYSSKEMLGKSINILVPSKTDEHKEILEKYKRGEKLEHFETKRIKKNGTEIDVSLTISPMFDEKKQLTGFSTITRDITKNVTERKKSEDKFRGFLEAAPDAIVIVNNQGKIQLVNAQTERLFGYKRIELIGKEVEILIPFRYKLAHPGHRGDFFSDPRARAMGAGLNLFGQHKDGKEFPVEISLSPLETEEGLLVSAAIRDITEQKQVSQYARSLIEASLDPLVTISADGKILDVNEASAKVTGVPREKLIGTDFSNYFTEPVKAQEGYKQVFEKGFVADYPLTIRHRSGNLTDVLYNASVYKDDKGNVLGVFAAARNITEQKQFEKKLIEYKHFFNNTADFACIANMEGYFEILNPNFEKILGYSEKELLENHFLNFIHPDDIDSSLKEIEILNSGALTISFVNRYRKKDGDYLWFEWNSTPNPSTGKIYAIARDVTEQKQASQYTRSLIEASLDPLVTISADGKITDVNEASVNVTGVPREKLIGTDFTNYFTEPVKAQEGYKQVFEKGFVADYPLTIKHKNGKLTDVLYNASVYKDDKGNVLGVFAAARDVTEIKKAEAILKNKTTQLTEAQQSAHFGSWDWDVPANRIEWTDELFRIYGFSPQEFEPTYESFLKYIHPDDREYVNDIVQQAYKDHQPFNFFHRVVRLDGTERILSARGYVYTDSSGNTIRMSGTGQDVTEIKKAEEEINKNQAYTRSLIEASLDPLVTISADGKILDVNEASVKVTGVLREKLIGTDFSNYFTEPHKAQESYQQVFEKGFVADYPLTIRHRSGNLTDVLYNASVYKDDKGNVLGVFAAARDITAQKQLAEREVAEREKELIRIEELERFRKLTVGRELKMIELKKEIEELKKEIEDLKK